MLYVLKPETPSTIMASSSTDGGGRVSPHHSVVRNKTKALRIKVDFLSWIYKDQLLPACSPFQKLSGLTNEEPVSLQLSPLSGICWKQMPLIACLTCPPGTGPLAATAMVDSPMEAALYPRISPNISAACLSCAQAAQQDFDLDSRRPKAGALCPGYSGIPWKALEKKPCRVPFPIAFLDAGSRVQVTVSGKFPGDSKGHAGPRATFLRPGTFDSLSN